MSYQPKIINPLDKELDILEVFQERYWHSIDFFDIEEGDRVLVIRMGPGARITTESVVDKYDQKTDTWVNKAGAPIVSVFDIHIFRAGEYHDDQSAEDPDSLLGS